MNLDHMNILVRSLAQSMPYYDTLLNLLEFEKVRDHIWQNADGFVFQFFQARSDTHPYERYGAGLNHLGFGVDSPDRVNQIRDAMASAGFPVPEIQNLGGAQALFMKDPDGIRFEITYYPPGVSIVD